MTTSTQSTQSKATLVVWSVLLFALLPQAGNSGLLAVEAAPDCVASSTQAVPKVSREFRGVWIATVANIDWPSKPGLSTGEQRRELVGLLDQAAKLHLNAIVFQVRPAADALYNSELEPWSEFLTGAMGKPPSELYDPLAFAVEEAHRRGLELHAWFNPYRAHHPAAFSPISDNHISKTHPEWVRTYGKYLWLDPGEQGAADHSIAVIRDVVRRYDIDGVHLDDYFYPYPIQDDAGNKVPFPDDASWARAVEKHDPTAGPMLERDDWRRQNVDTFIQRLYREIKAEKSWVKFGISPFGIWRPGHPKQIKGFDQFAELYADARKWLVEGWIDYMTPQLYWKIDRPSLSYPVLLQWWHEQNGKERHLWPGNYTSRLGFEGKGAWAADEILAQIEITREQPGATGNIHFSMKPLARNSDEITDRLIAGPYHQGALVPATPWLSTTATPIPSKPKLAVQRHDGKQLIQITVDSGQTPWLSVVRKSYGHRWQIEIVPGQQTSISTASSHAGQPLSRIAVCSVNRIGQEGPVSVIEVPTP